MDERVIRLLEFDKIRDRLAGHTSFSLSHELALSLLPTASLRDASRAQQAGEDAQTLLRIKPSYSVGGARDIRAPVHQAALGGIIEPQVLLDVAATLDSAAKTRDLITRLADQLPVLGEIASDIVDCSLITEEIGRCIGRRAEVLDSASATLARVRIEARQAHDQLRTKLDSYIASPAGRTVLQEPIVTVRQGRYVVPVKSDFRGQVRGIVHDVSASGATLFMEPLDVVDLNNRWRELQLEEEREVERVLRRLAADIGEFAGPIVADVELLAEIDLHLAKAKYAEATRAIRPKLIPMQEGWRLSLRNARHPLLGENVVPVSISLGGDFFVLVITGPNTGGKTVALKTVGLLALMALSGLAVPADNGTTIPVFGDVAADIGDEQSIEQSLSTFSAHVGSIIQILKRATPNSLVLLDELGAGTDPAEGSALARALLSHIVRRRIPTIATTHYSEVKVFAHATAGVQNASVEFDVETLAPTYRLAIGTPGASNALAIALRLGLDRSIVEDARSLLDPTQIEIERLLGDLQSERDALEAERRRLADAREAAERDQAQLAEVLGSIEDERARIMDQARDEIVRQADDLLRTLQRAAAAASQPAPAAETVAQAAAEVATARQAFTRHPRERRRPPVRPRPLRIGESVRVRGIEQIGELAALYPERNEAEVRLGSFKTRVRLADLEPVTAQAAMREHRRWEREERAARPEPSYLRPAPGVQLDLRGRRVDEVFHELDRYLNEAYLTGMPAVRVIHGKGTGALRQVVRDQLTSHPLVRAWTPAEQNEGGEGATIAQLAM